MKLIGWLVAACIIIALLRLAMAVLVIALFVLLIWGAITRPKETLTLLAMLVLAAWPHLLIVLIALGIIGALLTR